MASAASPLTQLGMARPSPSAAAALPADAPRIPEVLVVCLVHDSPALRAKWPELLESVLSPLFCRYVALQEDSRLLVGAVVYRSASAAELRSPLRPVDAVIRVPFLPTPRFTARVAAHFGTGTSVPSTCLGDGSKSESMLVDGVAAALEMLSSRDKPRELPQWAQAALQAHHSPVASRHVVHIVASSDGTVPTVPAALRPALNSSPALDTMSPSDMVDLLAKRSIGVCTVVSSGSSSSRTSAPMLRTLHAMLAPQDGQDVDVRDIMGSQWKAPAGVDLLGSGIALCKASGKRARMQEVLPNAKRAKATVSPVQTQSPLHTHTPQAQTPGHSQSQSQSQSQPQSQSANAGPSPPKADQKSINKIYLLQQQLATMLKNLSQLANKAPAAGIQRSLQTQMIEQIKQQLTAQQNAIRAQAEVLRSGRQPNLNVILQALINIDKEAKESGLHLGGPSNAVAKATQKAPRPPQATGPAPFWQGLLRWNFSNQPGAESFALVAATASAALAPESLALPWPNALTVKALLAASSQDLQRFIVKHRVPCVLLTLRQFPAMLAVRGAENNEANYRMLATLLERNQRVAYVPHGAQDCGLLVAALPATSAGAAGASGSPRLIALVFNTPIPFGQLSASTPQNRGVMPVSAPTQASPMHSVAYDPLSLQTQSLTPSVLTPNPLAPPNSLFKGSQTPVALPSSGLSTPFTFGDATPTNSFAFSQVLAGQQHQQQQQQAGLAQTQGLAFSGLGATPMNSASAGLGMSQVMSTAQQQLIPGVNPALTADQSSTTMFGTADFGSVDQLRAMGFM
ncbi:hypothetical protein MCUN1_000787 [Malassezia cuniculi]|uniref:Uncharacterized protein n=1 Tax=Malassezia cuniculi TaxID=948313 RepID=A0AAF0J5Z5_9BASI|nr:hypothetical protein MCUN1_000787 [Malassezia cuniculi]